MTKPAIWLTNGDLKHLFFNLRPVYITNSCFKDIIYISNDLSNRPIGPSKWPLWISCASVTAISPINGDLKRCFAALLGTFSHTW